MRCGQPEVSSTSPQLHPTHQQERNFSASSPVSIISLSSSSSSRANSWSSAAITSPAVPQPGRDRSMEDVWREIARCDPEPFLDHPHRSNNTHQHTQAAHPPTSAHPPEIRLPPLSSTVIPRPPPVISLPLSPSFELGFAVGAASDGNRQTKAHDQHQPRQQKNGETPTSPFASPTTPFSEALGSPSSGIPPFSGPRRLPEQLPLPPPPQNLQSGGGGSGNGEGGDRRRKRMIKNRESAARSRARKQAYTNELEVELTRLLQENADLRNQQDKLLLALAAQPSGKKALQRTSTAPF